AISVEGLIDNGVVDGVIPLMINAYDKGNQKKFLIEGSETPQSIPSWLWILLVAFLGWAAYYLIMNFTL
ncbi:MAG TPA: cytochrome C, partial [Chitinophagales bacterium]|nr:cytochrome C [Chitinophagales bacterium]